MLTLGVCVSLTVFMSDVTNGKVWLYWGFIDEWHLSTYSHLHYHTLLSLSQFGSVLYSFSSHSTARIIYINTTAYSGAVKTCLNKFKLADTWKCVAVGIWLDILWPDCDICHFTCIAFLDDTIHCWLQHSIHEWPNMCLNPHINGLRTSALQNCLNWFI